MADEVVEKGKLTEFSSFIADLPSVVEKFWNAVARPIFELSITLIVLFFALGDDSKVENQISTQLNAIPSLVESSKDIYGIKALIPVAVLIFLLGIAQGNSKLLRVIGAAIPGQLVSERSNLLLTYTSPKDIEEAWLYSDKLTKIDELNAEIDATIGVVPNSASGLHSKARTTQGKSDVFASNAAFIKGLLSVTSVVVIVLYKFGDWPIHERQLAVIFAISSIALVYLAFSRIQAEREYASLKVKAYIFIKKNSSEKPARVSDVHTSRLREIGIDTEAGTVNVVKDEYPWKLKLWPRVVLGDLGALGIAWIAWIWIVKSRKITG
jgi:hypothetical protein